MKKNILRVTGGRDSLELERVQMMDESIQAVADVLSFDGRYEVGGPVEYRAADGETWEGYITALHPELLRISIAFS